MERRQIFKIEAGRQIQFSKKDREISFLKGDCKKCNIHCACENQRTKACKRCNGNCTCEKRKKLVLAITKRWRLNSEPLIDSKPGQKSFSYEKFRP